MMSRRGATLTGVLAAGLTATVGYAGAQVLVLGPSAPSQQTQSYSAPQATYTPAAPVASTSSS
jgi:hypothetical protein